MSPASSDEVDRAILAAETNPRGMTERQKAIVGRAARQAGETGNRARRALDQDS